MICSQCKARNPVGNRFCRECGAKLVPLEGELAAEETARIEKERLHERVAGILSAAWTLTEQKRYEQALPLAREAALLLPDSTAAHSLLANLYERTDQEREAIREMERVVELNPESAGDREKLDQLRRGVHVLPVASPGGGGASDSPAGRNGDRAASSPAPIRSYLPFIAGGAAAAVVAGVAFSMLGGRGGARNGSGAIPTGTAAGYAGNAPAPAPSGAFVMSSNVPPPGAPAKGTLPPASDVRADPFVSLGIAGTSASPAAGKSASGGAANAHLPAVASASATLPLPFRAAPRSADDVAASQSAASPAERSLPPIIAVAPTATDAQNAGPGFGSGQRLTVGPPTSGGGNSASNDSAANPNGGDNGYIRITVGGSQAATANHSRRTAASSGDEDSKESPLARARRMQGAGRYSDAAAAYREALNSGMGSPGDIHQALAECDHRLGDDAGARSEYQAAITAYDREASSGRSVAAAQRGSAACRAALEALGG